MKRSIWHAFNDWIFKSQKTLQARKWYKQRQRGRSTCDMFIGEWVVQPGWNKKLLDKQVVKDKVRRKKKKRQLNWAWWCTPIIQEYSGGRGKRITSFWDQPGLHSKTLFQSINQPINEGWREGKTMETWIPGQGVRLQPINSQFKESWRLLAKRQIRG
jgi:hypothetical protein